MAGSAKLREIETIISTDLLELLVLLCSIIIQQYTLQCTIHRDSSATLPLPPDQHHISDVAVKNLGGTVASPTVFAPAPPEFCAVIKWLSLDVVV